MRIVVERDTLEKFWEARLEGEKELNPEIAKANEWKQDEPTFKPLKEEVNGYTEYIELPTPLDSIGFDITSQGKSIQCGFNLRFREPKVLDGLSRAYAQKVRERKVSSKLTFYPTTTDLTGYLLNADNEPIMDIVTNKNDGSPDSRIISFGAYGSKIRRYNEIGDLRLDISELSAIADSVIQCCVSKYNSSRKSKIRLPHMDLYMGINLGSSSFN